MLNETSFQMINRYSIRFQNRAIFQSYCNIICLKGGVNQMWILKNSKDLLEDLKWSSLSSYSIKTFNFSTLCTAIPHSFLKDKLKELVQLCFIKKNDERI